MHSGQEPLHPQAIRLLTSGCAVSPEEARVDSRQVTAWRGSNDDLFVSISERLHLPATMAVRYVRNRLLALGRRPDGIAQPPEV